MDPMKYRTTAKSQDPLNSDNNGPDNKMKGFRNVSLHQLGDTSQVLLEERSNVQKYRHFYSLLKFAHSQLQVSYAALEEKYAASFRDWHLEKQKLIMEMARLSSDKDEVQALCVELKKNSLTEERLELIKIQVARDIEQKTSALDSDAQIEAKSARNQLREMTKEFSRLKADSDQFRVRAEVEQEKKALLHESEKNGLVETHQEILNRFSSLLGSDAETLANLYRENSEMRAKCNLVLSESQKAKQMYDTQMIELKNDLINAIDKLSVATSDREKLASRCEALEEQVEMFKTSLNRAQADLAAARQKAIDCEKARLSAEKQCEGVAQRARFEMSDMRLESQRQRVEVERQRDELAFQIQDLTNQLALAFARFEEVEEMHNQREIASAERENELRRSLEESADESRQRCAEMFRQLERSQVTLRDLTAQHKSTTLALTESEQSKTVAQERLSALRAEKETFREEVARLKQELDSREKDVRRLEGAVREMAAENFEVPERDARSSVRNDPACEIAGVREAYSRLLERFNAQKTSMSEKIHSLNAQLIEKIGELEQLRQEHSVLKNSVPIEEFSRVQEQLREFQRRKEGYWHLLQQTTRIFPDVAEIPKAS